MYTYTHKKYVYAYRKKKYIYVYMYTCTYTYIHIDIPHGYRRQTRTQHRGLEGPCQFQLACPLIYFRASHFTTHLCNLPVYNYCAFVNIIHRSGNHYPFACIIYI